MNAEKLLERAELAKRESKNVEFKVEFDVSSSGAWCEVIKDIVAMANSGGGIIIFGVENNGASASSNVDAVLSCDIADVTNRIAKYTNFQFSDIEIVEVKRGRELRPSFLISGSDVPIPFAKPGTYGVGGGKQKTAFSQGTVYFRHGGKSEPGTRDDLVNWRDRELGRLRKDLLSNLRKVIELPSDHTVAVVPSVLPSAGKGSVVRAQITTDPSAQSFVPLNAEEIWPYRQTDVIRLVNSKLSGGLKINSHDMLCIKKVFDISSARPEFAYKPHKFVAAQYSTGFVEWILQQFQSNRTFFVDTRKRFQEGT